MNQSINTVLAITIKTFPHTNTPLPSGRLQWPCAERLAGCSAEGQAQCWEQQHGRDQCRDRGPQWRPRPHDCGRYIWSWCGNNNHCAQMGHHIPHPQPTGKGWLEVTLIQLLLFFFLSNYKNALNKSSSLFNLFIPLLSPESGATLRS